MFNTVDLFAGAGGLSLGLEQAGFNHVLLNDIDKDACNTLKFNKPRWNVVQCDVKEISSKHIKRKVDLITGGFPCQPFSYAGKNLGFNDIRGTVFFEVARIVDEIKPKVFMLENVKGLIKHDNGNTFNTIKDIIKELGYELYASVINAVDYGVPQKRERIILVGVKLPKSSEVYFEWPEEYADYAKTTMRDVLFKGKLYDCDVPFSNWMAYSENKAKVLKLVPPGGCWRDLPVNIQKSYMGKSYYSGGGKTGMARRLSLDEPCLTLTTSPAQKQTDRCHPIYTRPLTTREYARVQTFPDDWEFMGSLSSIYRQIGNAVPVKMGYNLGLSLIKLLQDIDNAEHSK